jgi:cell division transport system permease protein
MGFKLYNLPYFFKEAATLVKKDLSSNILSALSLSMIFFILAMTAGFGASMSFMAGALEDEAEISVYFSSETDTAELTFSLEELDGVKQVIYIREDEAKEKMSQLLGDDSRVLSLFDYNPFSPYLEVGIELQDSQKIAETVRNFEGVEYVRDNREILDKIREISGAFNLAGIFVMFAVGAATVVLTSHIIRQGIYLNRDSIGTLQLLGAPEGFIYFPFIVNGIILSLFSGILSITLTAAASSRIYSGLSGALPFLVLPEYKTLFLGLAVFTIIASLSLGILGSVIGIKSTNPKK